MRAASKPRPYRSLADVREQAAHCRDCPLWKNATPDRVRRGPRAARIVFVGEQPGDQEDLAGKPFVGPAGKLLDRALARRGIDRTATYVTNAVKHFKFEPRGKRRIHKKPNELEISACHQWLERELTLDPARTWSSRSARPLRVRSSAERRAIEKNRGRVIPSARAKTAHEADVLVTVHPSFLLRVPDEDRDAAFDRFVADLKLIRPYPLIAASPSMPRC